MPAVLIEMGYLSNPGRGKAADVGRFSERHRAGADRSGRRVPRSSSSRSPRGASSAMKSMPPRAFVVYAGLAAVLAGWSRRCCWFSDRAGSPPCRCEPGAIATPAAEARKIRARLFYVDEQGTGLAERRAGSRCTARARSSRRSASSKRRLRRRPSRRWRRRFPQDTRLRTVFFTKAGDMLHRFERRVPTESSRRHDERDPDGVCARQRADVEPAGRHRRADSHRRQGSRHARGPSRPAAAHRTRSQVDNQLMRESTTEHADQLRPTHIHPQYLLHPEGSVLIESGRTKVICTASVEDRVPPFLRNTGKGWVTAEYGMLPRATSTRTTREASAGQSGRPDAGNPAADRPLAALGDEAGSARRAHRLDRLRRHSSRRRHAHRGDYRRVRRARARAPDTCARRDCWPRFRCRTTSPRRASASSTTRACSIWPTKKTRAPKST